MLDQASELRERMQALRPAAGNEHRAARRILVCGAGPQIGASSLAANLAVELAGRGKRVLLSDSTNENRSGNYATAAQLCRVEQIFATDESPQRGAAGVAVALRGDFQIDRHGVAFDVQLVDAGEGLAQGAQSLAPWADDCIIVSRRDDASVMQAYAVVKQFTAAIANAAGAGAAEQPAIWLVVNQSPDAATAEDVFARFDRGCRRFLGIEARLLGWLPEEQTIAAAAECRAPFVLLSPRCAAARALGAMAAELQNTAREGKLRDGANRTYFDQGNVDASLPHARSESPVAARS